MTKDQAERKLKALQALAERGVGGEKETAKRFYEELKKKYGIGGETKKGRNRQRLCNIHVLHGHDGLYPAAGD